MVHPTTLNSIARKRILIVEDNSITSFHLQKLLQTRGFEVSSLNKAEDVEKLVKEISPDVILMDIMLSGKMTGLEAAENLRQFSAVPIIFLSALTDKGTKDKIYSIPNTDRQSKPFDETELLSKINDMLST